MTTSWRLIRLALNTTYVVTFNSIRSNTNNLLIFSVNLNLVLTNKAFRSIASKYIDPLSNQTRTCMVPTFIQSAFDESPLILFYWVSFHRLLASYKAEVVFGIEVAPPANYINILLVINAMCKIGSLHYHARPTAKGLAFQLELPGLLTIRPTNHECSESSGCDYCSKTTFGHHWRRYSHLNERPGIEVAVLTWHFEISIEPYSSVKQAAQLIVRGFGFTRVLIFEIMSNLLLDAREVEYNEIWSHCWLVPL